MCYFVKKILEILEGWNMENFALKLAMSEGWIFDCFDILIFKSLLSYFKKRSLFLIMFSLKDTARKLEKDSLTLNYAAF